MPKKLDMLKKLIFNTENILKKAFYKTDEVIWRRLLDQLEFNLAQYKSGSKFFIFNRGTHLENLQRFVNIIKKTPSDKLTFQKKIHILIGFLLEEQSKVMGTKQNTRKQEGSGGKLLRFYDDIIRDVVKSKEDSQKYINAFHDYQECSLVEHNRSSLKA